MPQPLILASASDIRQTLLKNAGLNFDVVPARVDEDMVRDAMIAEGAPPRDIADAHDTGGCRLVIIGTGDDDR